MEQKLFTPNKKLQKVLASGFTSTCAYWYKDGIVVKEEKRIKQGNLSADVDIIHIFPCEVPVHAVDYDRVNPLARDITVKRVVFHEAAMLVHGLKQINIAFSNNSTAIEKMGFRVTSIYLYSPEGGLSKDEIMYDMWAGRICVQPDPYDRFNNDIKGEMSIMDWSDENMKTWYRPYSIVWYGEKL